MPSKEAIAELKQNSDLHNMMQLCEAKNCWLSEMDDVPASEMPLWIAYYDLQNRKNKQAQKQAAHESRMKR